MVKKFMVKKKKQPFFPFISLLNKRGQIRGVDFALAMLIFILVFSQVILVLSTLIFPSLLQLETFSHEEELRKIYHAVFYSEGVPANWAEIPTSSLSNFRFGLALNKNKELDFSKINRLVSDVSDYWRISYLNAKISYSLTRDFAIEVSSPLDIIINSVNVAFGEMTISGNVQYFAENLTDVRVWAFAIDTNNNVATNTTTTKKLSGNTIGFVSTLNINSSQAYSIAVFAEYGMFQTYELLRMTRESGSLEYYYSSFDFRPFARSYSSSPSKVEVFSPRDVLSDEAEGFILFPFTNTEVKYFKVNLDKKTTEEGEIYYGILPVPAKGFAVMLVQERVGDTYRAGYIGIPNILTFTEGGLFGPNVQAITSSAVSVSHYLIVRDVLIRCRMWYW